MPGADVKKIHSFREKGKRAVAAVRDAFAHHVFAEDDMTLQEAVVELAKKEGFVLAPVESCTAGGVCSALGDVPGASAVLDAGWVTYANAAKVRLAGVDEDILKKHGAVSGQTARAMADAGRRMVLALHDGEDRPTDVIGIAVSGVTSMESTRLLPSGRTPTPHCDIGTRPLSNLPSIEPPFPTSWPSDASVGGWTPSMKESSLRQSGSRCTMMTFRL